MHTFENRNVIHYNLKITREIKISSLGEKNNILIKNVYDCLISVYIVLMTAFDISISLYPVGNASVQRGFPHTVRAQKALFTVSFALTM